MPGNEPRSIRLSPGFLLSACRVVLYSCQSTDMAEKMPARLRKRHDEATRAAIKTTQLINRLQDYALNDDIEVDPGRVRAIEILLRKTLPDQKAIEHTGEVNTLLTVAQQIEQASKAIEHEPLRIVNASGDD